VSLFVFEVERVADGAWFAIMSTEAIAELKDVKERLSVMERKFDELQSQVLGLQPVKKDWRATVGLMPDDEESREAARLGREWREQSGEE